MRLVGITHGERGNRGRVPVGSVAELSAETDPSRDAVNTAGRFWTIRPPGEQAVEPAPAPVSRDAHRRLMGAVEAKLAQGFQIESQADKYVVLVKRPRRCLGVTLPGGAARVVVSLDQRGHPTVRG
jgi:hypothetical protein